LDFGSRERSTEDSKLHVLRRRLNSLDEQVHFNYLEIECARIVERLRAIRDTYREVFTDWGFRPLSEMYWVVFRYGTIQASVSILREACFEYISATAVSKLVWTMLFEMRRPLGFVPLGSPLNFRRKADLPALDADEGEELLGHDALKATLKHVISENSPSEITFSGGPFSREAQLRWWRQYPWPERFSDGLTASAELEMRRELWDRCRPWTEGLTKLFDAVQGEVEQQYEQLPPDARRARREYENISIFRRLSYIHLLDMRNGATTKRPPRFCETDWISLMRDLDEHGVSLDQEASGQCGRLIEVLRKKGKTISTWQEAFQPNLRATLEDGKSRLLKPLLTKLIQNAARSAARSLGYE
jgi:hypothetical protein